MIDPRDMKIKGIVASSRLLYDWDKMSEPYSWDDVYYEGMDRPLAKREITEEWGTSEL
jgi:hypothetical protein